MPMPDWQFLIVHHSATKDQDGVDTAAFRRYHTETKEWSDIGYHFVVEEINGIYQALIGRPLNLFGSHAPNIEPVSGLSFNRVGIGICLAGNFSNVPPSQEMLEVAATRVCIPLMQTFGIPKHNVIGHRDTGKKTECPGLAFVLGNLRSLL